MKTNKTKKLCKWARRLAVNWVRDEAVRNSVNRYLAFASESLGMCGSRIVVMLLGVPCWVQAASDGMMAAARGGGTRRGVAGGGPPPRRCAQPCVTLCAACTG